MLEVVHLSKIYKSKKGDAEVKALDDVSLRFPEKGMVFLLGKSGSGKSTLLNVCGGLDSPTSGEIIVKGRSSKDFTQGDFDSYRNTYIGFIFQEYNILNEFTVEDNIALALELQGKPKDRNVINDLLKQVDLEGMGKRKPNTLSGGQKQRIAIARALIKSPEIIMADEPTGALDSNTGKQVFETLKKLSCDKLVIVVSHDRDFAEQYGDRIIELKDGKILSDVTKTEESKKSLSENVTIVGNTICVKNGKELTDNEFDTIKGFLRSSEANVVISNDEQDVKSFKEVARINDDGNQEVFKDTDEKAIPKKQYSPQDSKFIRSRLPLRHAFKIGTSSLRTKPFRLAFTILLCVVAFTLLGVLSTMMLYDSDATFKQTLKDARPSHVRFEKNVQIFERYYNYGELQSEYKQTQNVYLSKKDIDAIKQRIDGDAFGVVDVSWSSSFELDLYNPSDYYFSDINYVASSSDVSSISLMHGNMPSADNEIVISSYLAEAIVNCKTKDREENWILVDSVSELIGIRLYNGYTICGIFDSGVIDAKYDVLKEGSVDINLMNEFQENISDGIHTLIITNDATLKKIAESNSGYFYNPQNNTNTYAAYALEVSSSKLNTGSYYYKKASKYDDIVFINGKSSVGYGEVVVNYKLFARLAHNRLEKEREKAYIDFDSKWFELENFKINAFNDPKYSGLSPSVADRVTVWELYLNPAVSEQDKESYAHHVPKEGEELYDLYLELEALLGEYYELERERAKCDSYYKMHEALVNNYYYDETGSYKDLTSEQRKEIVNALISAVTSIEPGFFDNFNIMLSAANSSASSPIYETATTLTVVGYAEIEEKEVYNDNFYITDSLYNHLWEEQKATIEYCTEYITNYVQPRDAIYSGAFASYDGSEALSENLLNVYNTVEYDANDTRIKLVGGIFNGLEFVDDMIASLSKIFLIVGCVIAVFACLLLSNFISMSISNKKREIGILRAVGARGSDVFKIFFSESFVITLICTVLSIVASIGTCILLNKEVNTSLGASIFNFGIISMGIIFALAILTAIIATFLPVRNAASKKPVESIRAL